MTYDEALARAVAGAAAVGEPYVVLETTSTVNGVIKLVVLTDYHTMCIHSWGLVLKDEFRPSNTKIHTIVNPDGTIKR